MVEKKEEEEEAVRERCESWSAYVVSCSAGSQTELRRGLDACARPYSEGESGKGVELSAVYDSVVNAE